MHKFQEQHGRKYHKYISGLEAEEKAGKENVRKDLLEKMKAERANVLETYGSGLHGSGFGGSGFGGSGLGGSGHGNHTSNGHIVDQSTHYIFNFGDSAFPNVQQLSLPTSSARGSEDPRLIIGRMSALPLQTPLPVLQIADRNLPAISNLSGDYDRSAYGAFSEKEDRNTQKNGAAGGFGRISPSGSLASFSQRQNQEPDQRQEDGEHLMFARARAAMEAANAVLAAK